MRYRNTKTGMESDQFSEADWKTGVPQKKGWVKNDERPVKTMPKDLVDFVFKKKPVVIEPVETAEIEFKQSAHFGDDKGIAIPDGKGLPIPGQPKPIKGERAVYPPLIEKKDLTPQVAEAKVIKKQSKTKKDDNPKQKRRSSKRNA